MASHKIAVALLNNQVEVTPNVLHCRKGHLVRWECKDGSLEIVFAGGDSPFTSGLTTVPGPGGNTQDQEIKKQGHKKPDYKYTAVVTTPGGKRRSKDPDIIVDDWSGGPGQRKAALKAVTSAQAAAQKAVKAAQAALKAAQAADKKATDAAKKVGALG